MWRDTAERFEWQGEAVLFDLDGTLVDSGASVLRAWTWLADELNVPFREFAPYVHGIPAGQVLAEVVGGLGEAEHAEAAEQLLARQAADSADVVALPGAVEALGGLPSHRWAIVTSGDLRLASARIVAAGLPRPRVLITADDVVTGKPDPAPYLLAAARLGAHPERCLVIEDAEAGVSAGLAAGMTVVGVLSSQDDLAGTRYTVADLSELHFAADRLAVRVGVDATP
jgi:sugar-phosphatase